MNKKLLKEFEEKLGKEKTALEEQLKTFTEKDSHLKDDWDSKYPSFNGEFGGSALEVAADEVEEYSTRLPVEYSLETHLRDINVSLEKIKKGNYGRCDNCNKKIDESRLRVYPAARLCMKCQK